MSKVTPLLDPDAALKKYMRAALKRYADVVTSASRNFRPYSQAEYVRYLLPLCRAALPSDQRERVGFVKALKFLTNEMATDEQTLQIAATCLLVLRARFDARQKRHT